MKANKQSTSDWLKALIARELVKELTKEFRKEIRSGIRFTRDKATKITKEVLKRYEEGGPWGVIRIKKPTTEEIESGTITGEIELTTPYPARFDVGDGGQPGDKNPRSGHEDDPDGEQGADPGGKEKS